jgi:hypothetical protein
VDPGRFRPAGGLGGKPKQKRAMEFEKTTRASRHSVSPVAAESPNRSPLSSGKSTEAMFNRGRFVANDPFAADPDFNDVVNHFETIEPE